MLGEDESGSSGGAIWEGEHFATGDRVHAARMGRTGAIASFTWRTCGRPGPAPHAAAHAAAPAVLAALRAPPHSGAARPRGGAAGHTLGCASDRSCRTSRPPLLQTSRGGTRSLQLLRGGGGRQRWAAAVGSPVATAVPAAVLRAGCRLQCAVFRHCLTYAAADQHSQRVTDNRNLQHGAGWPASARGRWGIIYKRAYESLRRQNCSLHTSRQRGCVSPPAHAELGWSCAHAVATTRPRTRATHRSHAQIAPRADTPCHRRPAAAHRLAATAAAHPTAPATAAMRYGSSA